MGNEGRLRKIIVSLNALALVLVVIGFFRGAGVFCLLMGTTYGMSLGSILGGQKKVFHVFAVLLNVLFLLMGIFSVIVIVTGNTALKDGWWTHAFTYVIPLIFVITPSLNIFHIKKILKLKS